MNGFRRRLMGNLKDSKITTIRIDQNLTDPSAMITRIVDKGGIEAIRANSHRYVGVFDSTANVMSLRQLDDNDGTKYLDGTAAPITTLGNDVWMKLPQFWYKAEEYDTDVWDITFAYGAKPDDTFKEWDGKDLIGVYKAYVSGSKIYSVSGVTPSVSISWTNLFNYAENRGYGFRMVQWKHHCVLAALFYAHYCNTDSQTICGIGRTSGTTGSSNNLSMNDTNSDSSYVNFWGLEDWWGNVSEFIGNMKGIMDSGVHKTTVTEDDGSLRYIYSPKALGCFYKMILGEHLDMLSPESTNSTDYSKGYCDYSGIYDDYIYYSNVFIRVIYADSGDSSNGIVSIFAHTTVDGTRSSAGTRLAYRGDYIITD